MTSTENLESKTLFVGGTFDDQGGRKSSLAEQLFQLAAPDAKYYNGGKFQDLSQLVDRLSDYNVIYWFAHVPNDKEKIVRDIKKINPSALLITSKRNVEKQYSLMDITYHALSIKSNLVIEFIQEKDRYQGRILDPLGNMFVDYSADFPVLGKILSQRVRELASFTRVRSEALDAKKIPAPSDHNSEQFFSLVREYGEKFHQLIHTRPEAANRFFGNASFRCERGFPSFRKDNLIFVSERNIDKRTIGPDSFVAVEQQLPVQYYGSIKPSVDTPIQVKLYQHYPNIRFMLHGHVYIKGAPFTHSIVPCGALEEFDEITALFPRKEESHFAINLRGHGSLILADTPARFQSLTYYARPAPEFHRGYTP